MHHLDLKELALGAATFVIALVACVIVLTACGCASAPSVYHFRNRLNLDVIVADESTIQRACAGAKTRDDGTPLMFKDIIVGCWKESAREAWVAVTRPSVLLHELAHADGVMGVEAMSYKWPE